DWVLRRTPRKRKSRNRIASWRANFTPTATPATRRRRASSRRCKKPTTFYPTRRNGRNMTALAELDRTGEAPDPAARDFNGNGAGRGDFNKSIPEKRRTDRKSTRLNSSHQIIS